MPGFILTYLWYCNIFTPGSDFANMVDGRHPCEVPGCAIYENQGVSVWSGIVGANKAKAKAKAAAAASTDVD